MAFDPLIINITTFNSDFVDEFLEIENEPYFENVKFENDKEDDIEELFFDGDCIDMNTQFIDSTLKCKFIMFMRTKENQYYSNSFCDKYFNSSRFSENPEDIINMNKVDAWNIDWAYGLLFQAFVAQEYDLELPFVKKRNRKIPIIREKLKRPYKSKLYYDKDPIYEELMTYCKITEKDTYKRKSPRDQVLLHVFILDLLLHPYYRFCIDWHNKRDFTFEIKNSRAVAHIWMTIKGNDTCNYENFARGIRFKRRNSNMFTRTGKRGRCVYQLTRMAINDYKLKRNENDLAAELLNEALL